ncbi:MAG: hypothetical protein ACOX4M_10185 [Acetivibrionales bacterium]
MITLSSQQVPSTRIGAFRARRRIRSGLWSYEDAIKLKERIREVFRKAAVEPDAAERKRLLTFHIVGARFHRG